MSGAELIAAERQRQIDAEGWTAEHDDEHEFEQLALAAACYAAPEAIYIGRVNNRVVKLEDAWPWNAEEFKPDRDVRAWIFEQRGSPHSTVIIDREELRLGRIRELTKAGALIAAEIDRLLRAAAPGSGTPPAGAGQAGSRMSAADDAYHMTLGHIVGEIGRHDRATRRRLLDALAKLAAMDDDDTAVVLDTVGSLAAPGSGTAAEPGAAE